VVVGTVLVAGGVLLAGPAPVLSPAQRAVAAERGGRNLPLGHPPAAVSDPHPDGDLPRTSATPAAAPGDQPPAHRPGRTARKRGLPPISAFGDSVMLGARHWLDRRFPSGVLDAVEGRQPDPILHDVVQDADAGKLNPLVVIGVGDR
jgi:hypothetical protein